MNLDNVKLQRLKDIIERLEKDGVKPSEDIPFEFIMANCFPLIYEKIKQEMTNQYIEGFKTGLSRAKKKEDDKNEVTWNS